MKNIIAKIAVIAGAVVAFIGAFIPKFITLTGKAAIIGSVATEDVGFTDFVDTITEFQKVNDNLTWMPMIQYAVIICLVMAGVLALLALVQMLIKNKLANNIMLVASIIGIAATAFGFLALFQGVNEFNGLVDFGIAKAEYGLAIGAYLLLIGTLVASVFGLLCKNNVKRKRK